MIRVMLALLAALMALPAAAQDSMPPAPYAYNQLEDPAKEAEAAALMAILTDALTARASA
jgi:cytochrome c-type biogenesis protein CcmH